MSEFATTCNLSAIHLMCHSSMMFVLGLTVVQDIFNQEVCSFLGPLIEFMIFFNNGYYRHNARYKQTASMLSYRIYFFISKYLLFLTCFFPFCVLKDLTKKSKQYVYQQFFFVFKFQQRNKDILRAGTRLLYPFGVL